MKMPKFSRKAAFAFGMIAAVGMGTFMGTTYNLTQYSTQEAVNRILYKKAHEYSTQGGLNVLAQMRAQRDSLVPLVSWIWDDNNKAVFDRRTAYDSATTSIPCGIAVIGKFALHGDTNSYATEDTVGYMGKRHLSMMESRGWTMGNHTWYELGEDDILWYLPTGAMSSGKFSAEFFNQSVYRGRLAIRDSLGFADPRWFVMPGLLHNAQIRHAVSINHHFAFGGNGEIGEGNGLSTTGATDWVINRMQYLNQIATLQGLEFGGMALGRVGDRYNMHRILLENATLSFGDIRDQIFSAIANKGWAVLFSHRPTLVKRAIGADIDSLIGFLDSLQAAGTIRVVTPEEGYDLMFRTPISSNANHIWENFEAHEHTWHSTRNGVTYQPYSMSTWDSCVYYPDSTYHDSTGGNWSTGTANHGYGEGHGYAVLNWIQNASGRGSFEQNYWNAHYRNFSTRNCEWLVPNIGGGNKLIRFEVYAQVDSSLHTITSNSDSMYVYFAANVLQNYNNFNEAAAVFREGTSLDRYGNPKRTARYYSGDTGLTASNWQVFLPHVDADNPGDYVGRRWMQIVGVWEPPAQTPFIYIVLNKSTSLPKGAVRISAPRVTWVDKEVMSR